jgi:hypothetical protein
MSKNKGQAGVSEQVQSRGEVKGGKRYCGGGAKRIRITPNMIEAGVEVLEDWAADQEGPVSPFFSALARRVYAAMEHRRPATSLPRKPGNHRLARKSPSLDREAPRA